MLPRSLPTRRLPGPRGTEHRVRIPTLYRESKCPAETQRELWVFPRKMSKLWKQAPQPCLGSALTALGECPAAPETLTKGSSLPSGGVPEPPASSRGRSTPESRGWAVGQFPGWAEHEFHDSDVDTPWPISLRAWGSGTSALIQQAPRTHSEARELGTPGFGANQWLHLWRRGSGNGLCGLRGKESQNRNVRRTTSSGDVRSERRGSLPRKTSRIPSQSTAPFQCLYHVFPNFLAGTMGPGNISREASLTQKDFDGFFLCISVEVQKNAKCEIQEKGRRTGLPQCRPPTSSLPAQTPHSAVAL